jgi:hypothetical protein
VPSLKDSRPVEVADRIRQLAAGVTDPEDVATIESYARQVEHQGKRDEEARLFRPN